MIRKTLLAVVPMVAAAAALASSAAAAELSPAELLTRYQPVTVLTAGESFTPSSVDRFVAGATLEQAVAGGTYETVEMPEPGLPVRGEGWRLDYRPCSPAMGPLALTCYTGANGGPSVVYARHDVRAGAIVLQYWLFYAYNLWNMPFLPPGFAWQAHEGDWEVITVVLDEEQRPLEAAYSQHCTGERRAWASVPKESTHPVVYVAGGSHANLFAPGVHPIARSCYPAAALAFFDAVGVPPYDVAVPGTVLGPGSTSIERVYENGPRWLRFPGTWGETQYVFAAPVGLVPFGTSPVGPAFHEVWDDPLGTIAGYPVG